MDDALIDKQRTEIEEGLEELKKAEILISISQEDLESTEILFNSKRYPNSAMQFQQSIEKSTKAFAIIEGQAKFSELKEEYGHDTPKIYLNPMNEELKKIERLEKGIEQIPGLSEVPLIKKMQLESIKSKIQHTSKILSSVRGKGQKKIFSDDIIELEGAIKEMNDLILENKNWRWENEKIDYNKTKEDLKRELEPLIKIAQERNAEGSEEIRKQLDSITNKDIEDVVRTFYEIAIYSAGPRTINLILTILINPNLDFVRYPELKNPLEYYTSKNPLIQKMRELLEIQKQNLVLERRYFNYVLSLKEKNKKFFENLNK